MFVVTIVLAACLLLPLLWRDLPLAKALHGHLVVPAARFLNGLTAGNWLLTLMLLAGVATVTWMGGDMIVVSGLASPEILSVLTMVDVAALIDAALAAVALTGAVQGFAPRQWLRRLPRPRGRRARRTRAARRTAANDDDDPAWASDNSLKTRQRAFCGAGPLPHPATHASILMGGRVGERAGTASKPALSRVSKRSLSA